MKRIFIRFLCGKCNRHHNTEIMLVVYSMIQNNLSWNFLIIYDCSAYHRKQENWKRHVFFSTTNRNYVLISISNLLFWQIRHNCTITIHHEGIPVKLFLVINQLKINHSQHLEIWNYWYWKHDERNTQINVLYVSVIVLWIPRHYNY